MRRGFEGLDAVASAIAPSTLTRLAVCIAMFTAVSLPTPSALASFPWSTSRESELIDSVAATTAIGKDAFGQVYWYRLSCNQLRHCGGWPKWSQALRTGRGNERQSAHRMHSGDVETRGAIRPGTASQAITNARRSAEAVGSRTVATHLWHYSPQILTRVLQHDPT